VTCRDRACLRYVALCPHACQYREGLVDSGLSFGPVAKRWREVGERYKGSRNFMQTGDIAQNRQALLQLLPGACQVIGLSEDLGQHASRRALLRTSFKARRICQR
jgi:hypothetical protein